MKREELKELIASGLVGQGSAIDAGSVLPKILLPLVMAAMPLEVGNIQDLTNEQLDELEAGDVVVKITGVQKHAYVVSYKGEGAGQGLCLTYADAENVETVAYDRTDSGWVLNGVTTTHIGTN